MKKGLLEILLSQKPQVSSILELLVESIVLFIDDPNKRWDLSFLFVPTLLKKFLPMACFNQRPRDKARVEAFEHFIGRWLVSILQQLLGELVIILALIDLVE